MLLTVLLAAALAADPAPKSDSTMKDLVKDAAAGATTGADAAKEEKHEGPDVSKLPFTPDSIKQVVLSYMPKIQGCYEEMLANKKKAPEGSLVTHFVITPDGLVTKASVNKHKSKLKDPQLHDCVVAVLSTMAFPKPPNGKPQPIDFPFNLKAVH